MKSSIKLPFRPYQFAVFLILLTGLWYLLIQLLLQFKNSDAFLRQQLDWSGAALVTLLAQSGGVTIYRLYRQRKQIQSALINSERQQRERIERLPIGFFRTSPDGMLVAVNETLVQMAGAASREDLLQRKVSEFSLIAQPQNDWFARLGTQDEAVNFFALTRRLSGDEVWVRVNARAVKDERQRVVAVEGTVEDFDAHLRAEAALHLSLAQLSAIFNAGPHSLIFYDRDFRILAFNQPAENWVRAMTGRQIEKGEVVFTCIDPLLLDQFGESTERALRGEAVIAEKYCRPADGRGAWLQTHFSRVDDKQGELMGVLFAVYDLTEQKAAKEETRQTTASLEAFFNSSADSLLLLDPDLRVMAINRTSKVRTGLLIGHELKVGENLLTIIPAKDREKFQQDFYTALNGTPTHDQRQYEFANGSCWFDLTLSPVRCETGAITGVCFLARDITTEKQVLDQLHLLNEQHTRLLETAPVGIITIDQGGRILYANSAIERILRLPKEVICQRTIEDPAWHLIDRSGNEISIADTPFLRVKNQGQTVFGAEYAIPHEDGTCTQVSVNAAPLHDSGGGISGMVAAVTDVTERDETRRLLQLQLQRIAALRSIDRAITTRSPLTGVIHQILQQTVEQLGVDAAVLFLMDPDRQQLRCTASLGLGEPDGCGHVIDLQDPGVGELLSRRGVHRMTGIEEIIPLLKRAAPACQETFAEYIGISLVVKDEVIGVFEAFTRQPATRKADWIEYFRTLSGQMAVALDSDRLYQELAAAYESTLAGWSKALEIRDRETEGHSRRVTAATVRLAQALGVPETQLAAIRRGALLHDIGKLGVPDGILLKPGPLTPEEWEVMKKHPTDAYNLLLAIPHLHDALDIPYCHHERWNGSGYPRGLQGEEIPLPARIFAVVDVWDALSHDRPYRAAWSPAQIEEYLCANRGVLFDPQVVDSFLHLLTGPEPELNA